MTTMPGAGPAWAELVFHVLAHVPAARPMPSSLWNARYTGFCARHLGPASARSLAEDAAVLSQLLTSHELIARLQWVAFLFPDARTAREMAGRELVELGSAPGVNAQAVRALTGEPAVENAAELLRAATELESAHHTLLPRLHVPVDELAPLLSDAARLAPYLAHVPVRHLIALTRHGRAFDGAIYVGVPADDLGVSAEWVALQAAHEATVLEVAACVRTTRAPLGERDVEHAALVVLAARAENAGLQEAHARWWTGTELPDLPEVQAMLGEPRRRVVETVLARSST